jgi:hypothetical protein
VAKSIKYAIGIHKSFAEVNQMEQFMDVWMMEEEGLIQF